MMFLSLLLEILPETRLRDPPESPDDLKTALTDPADDEFGTKIFMTLEFKDFELSPVTGTGQLLTLRSDFLNNLGSQIESLVLRVSIRLDQSVHSLVLRVSIRLDHHDLAN